MYGERGRGERKRDEKVLGGEYGNVFFSFKWWKDSLFIIPHKSMKPAKLDQKNRGKHVATKARDMTSYPQVPRANMIQ